jgi:hypothetical protein
MHENSVSLSLMIRGDPAKSEYHLGETVKEFRQFFFTAPAEQLYFPKHLRVIFFLRKTPVGILSVMSCDNCVFGNLKKIRIITTERTH